MTFFHTLQYPLRNHPLYSLCRRHLSSSASPHHSIYVSQSTNPYFNLTYEDWFVPARSTPSLYRSSILRRLFRHKNPSEPLLLIYRDNPCVIIGRNQNPWKEVNFEALKARPGVPFIRRRSGGGTVYHDLGNTNFSIHLPRHSFDRHVTAQVILRAVRSLGIDASVNDRNDICIGKDKISFLVPLSYYDLFHVSGSAYKIVNTRAYHHGTMLISTHLNDLGDILRTNKDAMITKGVASVRSPVRNIQQSNMNVDHTSFTAAVISEFQKEYDIHEEAIVVEESEILLSIEHIKKGMAELPTWEWAYGQTPEFTYTINSTFSWGKASVTIVSKHGFIVSCNLNITESRLSTEDADNVFQLAKAIEGQRYGFVDDILEAASRKDEPTRNMSSWLKAIML
ncbi:Lipoate-protein ligase A [Leucoagaricus sp. SymC.cos]|nr:Lipoate-protein ligase A [Leucoagaricus sp. SymC.cos]